MSMTSPEKIREARIAQHLTVRDLADRAGVAPNSVIKAEHGRPLGDMPMHKILEALGITRSEDAHPNGFPADGRSPTVTSASRIVLDIPEGEREGLTPGQEAVLRREAEIAWLRARAGMSRQEP